MGIPSQEQVLGLEGFSNFFLLVMARPMLTNLVQWWEHRHDEGVLLLFYEELLADHLGTVQRVADFMDQEEFGKDRELVKLVVSQTTHAAMGLHRQRFTDHKFIMQVYEEAGLREHAPSVEQMTAKVRKGGGTVGQGKQALPADVRSALQVAWREVVAAKLGFADLGAMQGAWRLEREQRGAK